MADNNFNTSFNNSESETELPNFSILKPFDMEPRKKVSDEHHAEYKCQPKDVLSEQKVDNNSWCECRRFFKPMETEEESLCCRDNSEIPEENCNGNFSSPRVYNVNPQ